MPILSRFVLVFAATAVAAAGQIQRLTYVGDGAEHQMGRSIGAGRDVTLDGKNDFLVGARGLSSSATFPGRAYLFSGAGSYVRTFFGAAPGDEYGVSCALVGDADADGYPDILIGARGFDGPAGTNSGRAYLYKGETPSHVGDYALIATFDGAAAGAHFGHAVADVGDVDKDGFSDFAIGATYAPASGLGRVYVYSGATRALIATVFGGSTTPDSFGYAIAAARDVDGDGVDDFAVSAPTESVVGLGAAGKVRILKGPGNSPTPAFSPILTVEAEQAQQFFGVSIAAGADHDADGVPDLVVGSNLFDGPGEPVTDNRGKAYLFSGATGAVLWSRVGDAVKDWFGIGVACGCDLDGDGVADILVGACQTEKGGKGFCYAYEGAGTSELFVMTGEFGSGLPSQGDAFGFAVASAGDLDDDGASEFLVGSYGFDGFGGSNAGKAYLYSSAARCLYVGLPPPHVLEVRNIGWPRLGQTTSIRTSGAQPFAVGILGFSPFLAPQPFFGGVLFLDVNFLGVLPFTTDATGTYHLPIDIPAHPFYLGLTMNFQSATYDPTQVASVAQTNVLSLTTFW
jgi:hypothetical protein